MGYGLLTGMYQAPGIMVFGLLVVAVWTLIWKGLALWDCAKNERKGWFIAILVLNTMGLLPIIYLIWFKPKCDSCKIEVPKQEKKEEPKKPVAKRAVKKVTKKKTVKKKK
jgi:hypothetical protein